MMRKRYTRWQLLIMALRAIPGTLAAVVTCPCGSRRVSGSGDGPFQCKDCHSIWQ